MRVFMTGATGYTGLFILRRLLRDGHTVTALARDRAATPRFSGVSWIKGDLEDWDSIAAALPGHEAFIHHAIIWDDGPTELQLKDTRASAALFEAAAKGGVKHLIYTSSAAVHRPFKGTMSEETPIAPADYYGATKASGEMFLSDVGHQFGVACTVVRAGPVVGAPAFPEAPFKSHSRFWEIVRQAKSDEDIWVERDDGRQFISASDLAKVYSSILDRNRAGEIYLAMEEAPRTWQRIAESAIRQTGSKSKVIVQDASEEPFSFNVSKLSRELGLSLDASSAIEEHIAHIASII